MSIDELGLSLLARQDKQREDDLEKQRKARKRARREQLLGAAGGIAVNIGNRVLAQRAQEFMDKEFDMSSRAKYKQYAAGHLDTQERWKKMRETHDSTEAWREDKLIKAAQAEYGSTVGPTWDGDIPPEAMKEIKARSKAWASDFDSRYEESFKVPSFEEYAASTQRKYGRATSLPDLLTRGITDRFKGRTLAEGRKEREAQLRAEIDGFDKNYKPVYDDALERTGDAVYASNLVERFSGNHKTTTTLAPKVIGNYLHNPRVNPDTGEIDWVRGKRVKAGQVYGSENAGWFSIEIDSDGNPQPVQLIEGIGYKPNSAEIREARQGVVTNLRIEHKDLDDSDFYWKMHEEYPKELYEGLIAGHPVLTGVRSELQKTRSVVGGGSNLKKTVQGQLTRLRDKGMTPAMAAAFNNVFDGKGDAIQGRLDLLDTFLDKDYSIKTDPDMFMDMIADDVHLRLKTNPKDKKTNEPIPLEILIADAIAKRSRGLVPEKGERRWLNMVEGEDMVIFTPFYRLGSQAEADLDTKRSDTNARVELLIEANKGKKMPLDPAVGRAMSERLQEAIADNMSEDEIFEELDKYVQKAIKGHHFTEGAEMPQDVENFYNRIKSSRTDKSAQEYATPENIQKRLEEINTDLSRDWGPTTPLLEVEKLRKEKARLQKFQRIPEQIDSLKRQQGKYRTDTKAGRDDIERLQKKIDELEKRAKSIRMRLYDQSR